MEVFELKQLLSENTYPGRGIILGHNEKDQTVIVYFIMGRSQNSRNRVFVETEDGIRTQAFDPSLLGDPSLVIYHPVRVLGDDLIVTNGDQTDTIRDAMAAGKSYIDALRTRCFEPDPPIYTPRVSGVACADGSYVLSILKSFDGDPTCNKRFFFEYDKPLAGIGHFIHTYKMNAQTPPSFEGEPETVCLHGTAQEIADEVWTYLNEDNKVSLFVRTIDRETKQTETVIINKNR